MRVVSVPMIRTLEEMEPGETGSIVWVVGADGSVRRLLDLGLVPGTPIRFVRRAPLGCPLEVVVRGTHLSLRRTEARRIHVESL
ncbi:MAG: FeoA family protein [bacterium]